MSTRLGGLSTQAATILLTSSLQNVYGTDDDDGDYDDFDDDDDEYDDDWWTEHTSIPPYF